MTQLHHDRLLAEGAAPADQATTALTPSRRTSTSSRGIREQKAESTVPPQRQGKAQQGGAPRTSDSTTRTPAARGAGTGVTGSLVAKAKAARTATAKAANSRAVTATAATAKAASTKAATATVAATRKAATAARTAAVAKRAATKAGAAEETSKATVAKPAKATVAKPAKATVAKPAKATVAKPATAKATVAKPATAKATAAKPAPAEVTTAKPATAAKSAASEPAAVAKPATSKATVAKAATAEKPTADGRARSGGRHRAEPPRSTRIAAARTVVAQAATGTAPATRRPTPYKRGLTTVPLTDVAALVESTVPAPDELVVVKEAPARPATAPVPVEPSSATVDASAADAAGFVAALAGGRRGLRTRRLAPRRRPALYLAAALLGAMSIGGAATGAPTEVATTTVSHSVSVAEQLGIQAAEPAREVVDADATDRLSELVASRNQRAADRLAAADAQAEADRLAAEAAAEAARPKAVRPVEGARLTSGFGARWGTQHTGIDLAAPMRTPEYAAADGVVLQAGPASGFGLAVYIQHDNGDVTVYGHMDEVLVEPGQIVRAGDTIALVGNRGQSTGPHLHFEVRAGGLGGKKIDPLPWLRERGVQM